MRRSLLSCLLLIVFSTIASAAVHAIYRIELKDGSQVLAQDRPVSNGSVMVFHSYPKGVLTSVPAESVVRIQASFEDNKRVLQPGDVVYLGPTGGGQAPPPPDTTVY